MANTRDGTKTTVPAQDVEELLKKLAERLAWQQSIGALGTGLRPGLYSIVIKRVGDDPR